MSAAAKLDFSQVTGYLAALASPATTRELLHVIGTRAVQHTKQRFTDRGPGWHAKNPYFAYWQGHKTVPGTASGGLQRSIVDDVVSDHEVRVGSPLRYAATFQYGSDGSRAFVVYIEPELEPAANPHHKEHHGVPAGMRIARFDNGFPKGKLVLSQTPTAVKQLVVIEIKARPFLKEPDSAEADDVLEAVVRFCEHVRGVAA